MIPEERRNRIISKLMEKGVFSIDEFVKGLGVSRITVQRDINLLEERGLVEKIHGGVKWKKDRSPGFETLFDARLSQNYDKKVEIAVKAVELVHEHSTIFIDSSTTCFIFARELFKTKYLDLSIITTSPAIQHEALNYPDSKVISTGGELRQNFSMFVGKWVIEFLENVNIDVAFISAAGVSPSLKITTSNAELAEILKKVFQRAGEVNLLADSSKFFRAAMLDIGYVEQCRRIISDTGFEKKLGPDLQKINGLELIY